MADGAAVLDAAGAPRAAVVGHDWGALLAWAFTRAAPERVERLGAVSVGHPRATAAGGLTLGGEGTGHLAQRLLMLFVVDHREVASKLQAHALAGRRFELVARRGQALEEERHRHIQNLRDLEQTASGDAVQAPLILMCLLVGYADHAGELLLRQAHHDAPFADARADVPVRGVGALPRLGTALLRRCALAPRFTLLCVWHTRAFQPRRLSDWECRGRREVPLWRA